MTVRFTALMIFLGYLFILFPLVQAWADASDSQASPLFGISRITPDGEDVPLGRQVVIQFNRPMVALGRMERGDEEIPIRITPELKGQWRWVSSSALALQLDEKSRFKPSTRYKLTIKPGFKALDGALLKRSVTHTFITQRPVIRYTGFFTWRSPGSPVLRIVFNQPVSLASVKSSLFFQEKVRPSVRTAVKVEPDPRDRKEPCWISENVKSVYPQGDSPDHGNKNPKDSNPIPARRIWLISPMTELPLDTAVHLGVIPGLVSALGPESGIINREVIRFHTFPEFRFIGVRCYVNGSRDLKLISIDHPDTWDTVRASPLKPVSLAFSSPVIFQEVKETLIITPDFSGGRSDYDPWAGYYSYSALGSVHKKGRIYTVRLPSKLKAFEAYHLKESGRRLKDEFGRITRTPLDFTFFTDHRPAGYTLAHQTSVLEDGTASDVPLVVTNLNSITTRYRALTAGGLETELYSNKAVPDAPDIAFAIPLGVRNMLGKSSGAVYGSIETDPYPENTDQETTFFSQVTPFQIQVKSGHFNSLIWVTDLATGGPVSGADISLYTDRIDRLSQDRPMIARAVTGADGTALLPGNDFLDPKLSMFKWGWRQDDMERFFVKVTKDGKMGLLPLAPRFEIDTYRVSNATVYPSRYRQYGHIHAWGTTAQGVYRAGDTIQYKIYVRDQTNKSLAPPPLNGYHLTIMDPTGKAVHRRADIRLSAFGGLDGEFTVPETGAVGWYNFRLSADFTKKSWVPMKVLVSDFTPSPFKVTSQLNGTGFKANDQVTVQTSAKLHAGGPYTRASCRVTARLVERPFASKHPLAGGFVFNGGHEPSGSETVFKKTGTLDDQGSLPISFRLDKSSILFGKLEVESAVQDDRGGHVAASATVNYSGRTRFIGLKSEKWVYKEDEPAGFLFFAVDDKGDPAPGIKTKLTAERLVTKASRVKGAGNAFLTLYTETWEKVHSHQVDSPSEPEIYEFTPKEAGSYRITAEIRDTRGEVSTTTIHTWVAGKGRVVWHQKENNSLTIIAEKEAFRVGDKAKYLVKNPYPGATALITIERYGVLDHWVQTLETATPVIEFPVKSDYLPGFFFSVTVVSPRVEKPLDKSGVDLGKPAFKTGYVAVNVNDPHKEIQVEVKPEQAVYKPGDTVRATITAKVKNPVKPEPVELCVAVLDEAVFDLLAKGKKHFDPYSGFYTVDGLDLANYALLTRLVGRQKFEKKGANPGGDGAPDISMRSVFKFVSYWNPSLDTDEAGRATIEFTVPDNLTGWRIFAMAVTPRDRMGLGDARFKVNRPTEIRPVMPNQVTEGDRFKAGFSIMNRTKNLRLLNVRLRAKGPLESESGSKALSRTVALKPYERKTAWLELTTTGPGAVRFKATASDDSDGDGLEHAVPVNKYRSLETAATYGTTTGLKVKEPILIPRDVLGDAGEISVILSPSVIGNIEAAFSYMKDYPYSCWEQKLSKAIMASRYLGLKAYLSRDFSWEEAEELITETVNQAANFQAPDGGMAYYKADNRYVSPYLSAFTALGFAWLKQSGYTPPATVQANLKEYLERFLKQDSAPSFFSKGMAATVRAVALAALAESGNLTLEGLQRYKDHFPRMSLFGKALFLQAAVVTDPNGALAKEAFNTILSSANQTGGKTLFSEELDNGYSRILATPIRANAAILSAFTRFSQTKAGKELVSELPFKLVRYLTQARGNRDHWENTQENLFCMTALLEYSRLYETEEPAMKIEVLVDEDSLGKISFTGLGDDGKTLSRPLNPGDPGKNRSIMLHKKGTGRYYYGARLSYAPLEENAMRQNAGMAVRREISVRRDGSWSLLGSPAAVKPGEIVRVDLFVSLPAPGNFVVVDDPVPGGLEPVNRDLATASTVDADSGETPFSGGSWWFHFPDWRRYASSRWSFYHRELRHDSVRFYSDWLPAGNYHLSYTAQAIAEGRFQYLPAAAREMYDPDVYGKGLPGTLNVSREESMAVHRKEPEEVIPPEE